MSQTAAIRHTVRLTRNEALFIAQGRDTVRVKVGDLIVQGMAEDEIRGICKLLGALAQSNPCGGRWVTTLDRHLGRVVGLEPAAALARRIWLAFGGVREASRSTRMDGSQATPAEAWARN